MRPTAKVSEKVNKKSPARNMTVQLLTPYTGRECHNTHRHRQTDGQMTVSCQ